MSRLRTLGPLDTIGPEFIDDQEIRAGVGTQSWDGQNNGTGTFYFALTA